MAAVVQEAAVVPVAILTPEESQRLSDDAFFRNSPEANKPKKMRRFRVSSPRVADGAAGEYLAETEAEAWALHCDHAQRWPGGWKKNQAKIVAISEPQAAPEVARPIAPVKPAAKTKA